jgi:hypothetical protein
MVKVVRIYWPVVWALVERYAATVAALGTLTFTCWAFLTH